MLRLAAAVQAARVEAERAGTVATIGRLEVEPNATNAIPSRCGRGWTRVGPTSPWSERWSPSVGAAAGAEPVEESWTATVEFAADLRERVARALGDVPRIPTGAGHDAGVVAAAGVPAAMLFVRNPTGVSHSPAEHAEPGDCVAGVAGPR